MKTSELTGAQLDAWVAKAEGWELDGVLWREWIKQGDRGHYCEQSHKDDWHPSTDWDQGGPILDRQKIACIPVTTDNGTVEWVAQVWEDASNWIGVCEDRDAMRGPACLIAAMRAHVYSVFGPDVV